MTEEKESNKKVIGGPGITAGGNVTISGGSGQVAIGKNIIQTQTLSTFDKQELLNCLIAFQKEIAELDLPGDELSIVKGDVTAAIKEAKKEEPDPSKIKSRFESAIGIRSRCVWTSCDWRTYISN
ncbi:MAG: hypothetical protein EFT35_07075 [Methanophagales archaeon ANME-1-THS]|nr:MAG: hypothetical protein EFT35_07075 [Methanophagales archaeon ANME-1-THS]